MHDSQNKFTFHLPLKCYKMKTRHTGEADIYCDHHLCQLLASDTGGYLPSKNSLCSLIKLVKIVALSCVVTSDSQKLCEPYSVAWAAFSDHLIWHLNFPGFCSCFCTGDSALQGFRFLPLFCRQHLLSGRHAYGMERWRAWCNWCKSLTFALIPITITFMNLLSSSDWKPCACLLQLMHQSHPLRLLLSSIPKSLPQTGSQVRSEDPPASSPLARLCEALHRAENLPSASLPSEKGKR